MSNKKRNKGFTLLELTIALAIFMILSISVAHVWLYISRSSMRIVAQQNAFENARASMDALIANMQASYTIRVEVNSNNILHRLTLTQQDTTNRLRDYYFYVRNNMLHIGQASGSNEFTSRIAYIQIMLINNQRLDIIIATDCEIPIILNGSVDIRYKVVNIIQR